MIYPVVIHKDQGSDYGVTAPDLPGCFSAGRTIDEALAMAKEAIELHLEGLVEAGQAIPRPGSVEKHRARREYRGGTWALVSIDSAMPIRAVRLNITMPERVVAAVDRYAAQHGETRSGLLVRAVSAYIGRPQDQALKPARRGRHRAAKPKRA